MTDGQSEGILHLIDERQDGQLRDPLHPRKITVRHGIQIDIVVDYYRVDLLVSTIAEACKTGMDDDGRIFVLQVERAILIRGGKTQEDTPQGICSTSESAL